MVDREALPPPAGGVFRTDAAAACGWPCAADGTGHVPGRPAPADVMTPGPTRPGPGTELTEIVAVEGTAAADLAAALALLPPGAVLIDFGADAEVSLFFGPPPVGHPPAPGPGADAPVRPALLMTCAR